MWILIVEAGFALFLLVFIVWWTMFHGRENQPPHQESSHNEREPENYCSVRGCDRTNSGIGVSNR